LIPRVGSAAYTTHEYWERRFAEEESYEWLAAYRDVASVVRAAVPDKAARVLLVGTGNSSLPMDLADDGYSRVVATDYSAVVIQRMRERAVAGGYGDRIGWAVQDMRALTLSPSSFDAVIDKAGMDALLADGGDTWSPPPALLAQAQSVADEVARVLVPGGVFIQITFSQPHFRRLYLMPKDESKRRFVSWERHDIPVGLGYFAYVLRTVAPSAAAAVASSGGAGEAGSAGGAASVDGGR